MKTVSNIYGIRNKATKQFITFGAKCAWATTGAAKNAFNLHSGCYLGSKKVKTFSEQDEYELVNLLENNMLQ